MAIEFCLSLCNLNHFFTRSTHNDADSTSADINAYKDVDPHAGHKGVNVNDFNSHKGIIDSQVEITGTKHVGSHVDFHTPMVLEQIQKAIEDVEARNSDQSIHSCAY
ncbi:hypothetical protein L1049_002047 [Liquidambar formosana]|uniref:Uncharacterized protein n=1 Tax=Liquidambar formosana TaxID=63359 RepID=A0AAP0NIT2_LIQFO